ncbi:MAG: sulfite oxidase-like oxidoreductase [Alphaproteobacteria bacterium GM202ARS2]|nr:sulfite oxidase-like oxidoreductase [Alphaproteobacteria bacterium GM202ARS2]
MTNKDKLIRTKRAWAEKGQHLSGQETGQERLPPGQRLVTTWPVLDLGVQPDITTQAWQLQIEGAIKKPQTLDWQQLQDMPLVDSVSDMHCVTTWSRYDNHWRGLPTRVLLDRVEPKTEARFVMAESFDSYTTNLPIEALQAEDSLLAVQWEGKSLTREHGGPVRLLVPHLYLWKSAKWLRKLVFMTEDQRGFWEKNGYHNHADPWKEERYAQQES